MVRIIPTKYMSLKVLDFDHAPLHYVREDLGNLINLKYLSLGHTKIQSLPKSIRKLQNLETLDVKAVAAYEMPEEITRLRKLCHLRVSRKCSFEAVKHGLGGLTSLEQIRTMKIDPYGVVIRELGKLKKLRDLCLNYFSRKHGATLCSSMNEMHSLEKLRIKIMEMNEVINLPYVSPEHTLKNLCLSGKLEKFPNWIPKLQNLVKLSLAGSILTNDPLESLKDMPNLLFLNISDNAYQGSDLHFEEGGFRKLKKLQVDFMDDLTWINFYRGTLLCLETLELSDLPELKGILGLEKLRVVSIWFLQDDIEEGIYECGRKKRWIVRYKFSGFD